MTSNDNPDARPKKKFDLVSLKQENKLDIWLSINYLARANKGIQDFIVNHFYSFDDQVVEFFLPQLCNLALKEADPQTLVRFLMDKCSSLHLAVKMFFWFQAAVEDKVFPPTRTSWLWHECEMAAVNSKSRSTLRVETYNLNSQGQGFTYMSPSVYRLPEIALKSPGKSRHQRSASMPTITLETTSNNTVSPRSSKIPHSSSELPHNVILSKSEDTTVTKNNIEADCSPGTSEPSSPRGETRENSMHSSTELVPEATEATPEQPEPSTIATESTESTPDTTLDQSTDSTSVAKESCTEPSPVASSEHPTETLVTSNDSTSTTTELTTETLATSNETPQKTFLSSAMKIPSSSSMSDLTSAATLPPTEVLAQSTSSESTPIGSPRDLRETGSGSNITENNVDEKKLYRRSLPPENDQKNGLSKIVEITADELHFSTKKARHHFFHQQIQFISGITEISNILKRRGARSKTENNRELFQLLKQLQQEIVVPSVENNIVEMALAGAPLNQGVFLPIHIANGMYYRVLRVLPGDSFCLSSRDRVPYMIFVETVGLKEDPYDFAAMSETTSQVTMDINNTSDSETPATSEENSEGIIKVIDEVMAINREQMNSKRKMSTEDEDWVVLQDSVPGEEELSPTLRLAYPEYWAEKEARIRRTSPYGTIPGWKLHSVIVKSGDDLRQEQLAVQLISTFNKIFRKAEVPLWIYPYSVVATSSDGGLIETVPDAISLDTLKKRIPNAKTLEDYFISAYGERTSIKFLQAQRNFVESLAAYSLVCYLLQIKDRHNGNILLSKEGHVIHIDYGFMLTSSPGSLGFETAPFKLTDEFIKLMGGDMSDMANYFKLLLIRGFLEVRKHCSKILLLVETLLPGHKMRCFARRETVIRELKDRFRLELSDKECIAFVGDLIKQSARNWTTGSYDNYQYYLNGILV